MGVFRDYWSALHDIDGQATAGGLLVGGEHALAGLPHRLDDGVEADSVPALAPQRHAGGVPHLRGRPAQDLSHAGSRHRAGRADLPLATRLGPGNRGVGLVSPPTVVVTSSPATRTASRTTSPAPPRAADPGWELRWGAAAQPCGPPPLHRRRSSSRRIDAGSEVNELRKDADAARERR